MKNWDISEVMEIGAKIGRAIARDTIAEGLDRRWTGLDGQDGDVLAMELATIGIDRDDEEEWTAAVEAAKAAYTEATGGEVIRYDADGTLCMVWADGGAVRCPSQEDMDTLPVGSNLTAEEVDSLE
jgi:hypothetical protein